MPACDDDWLFVCVMLGEVLVAACVHAADVEQVEHASRVAGWRMHLGAKPAGETCDGEQVARMCTHAIATGCACN